MRILLLHGVNVWNTGDLGLLHTTVRRLRAEFGDGVEILSEDVFSGTGPGVGEELERLRIRSVPPLVPLRKERGWSRLRWMAHIGAVFMAVWMARVFGDRSLRLLPRSVNVPIAALMRADVVISKPGGHLYSAPGRWIGSPSYLFTIWASTALDRPTVIYAQSVGPFSSALSNLVARMSLRGVRLATAREPRTYRWLRRNLPRSVEIRLTADEAFLIDRAPGHQARPDGATLGITAISWHFPGHPRPELASARYEAALVRAARWYIDDRGGNVVLFRWLAGGHREDDEAVITRLMLAIDRPAATAVAAPGRPEHAVDYLGGLEMLVASRLHSAIFAMVAGTPALAIEYLPKTGEIMSMVVGDGWALPIEDVEGDDLVEVMERVLETRSILRERISVATEQLRRAALDNARLVRRLVSSD